jgi:MFS family permease
VPIGQGEVRLTAAGVVAAVALIAVVAIAYYTGGYVAGRMSRFDGGTQGRGVWVVGLILSCAAVTVGLLLRPQYDVFQWIDLNAVRDTVTGFGVAGVFTAIAVLLSSLFAAMLGGKVGRGYHKKVDRAAD